MKKKRIYWPSFFGLPNPPRFHKAVEHIYQKFLIYPYVIPVEYTLGWVQVVIRRPVHIRYELSY